MKSRLFQLIIVIVCLILVLNASPMNYSVKAAPVLDINVSTDKLIYNVGESVKITGNVTLDGVLQTNTLAAVEVDDPHANPYVIRTVDTGNISGQSWWIQILNFYTSDSHGNPQTVFYRGTTDAYFNLTLTNTHPANTLHLRVGAYVQGSNNRPVQAYYPILGDDILPGHIITYLQSFSIPTTAPTGEARLYMSVFSDSPQNMGYAHTPERSVNFSIETATPRMPQQPQAFNVTYAIPSGNVTAGNYSIYATTHNGPYDQTAIDIRQYTLRGPVPVVTFFPSTPIISQTVTFNGSASSSPYGTIVGWHWDFGDGTSGDGAIATHAYYFADSYPVSLTLTDSIGVEFTSISYTVGVLEAWPMFRHDPQRIGSSTSLSPVKNTIKWSKTIGPVNSDPWMYSSPAVTPAIMGNSVFVGSTNGTVYAFNATDGQLLWAQTPSPGFKFYSSPAFADGMVFIGSDDNRIWVLNATNGSVKYSITTGGPVYSSVAIVKDRVYVGSQDSKIYAFYLNGTSLWTSSALNGTIASSPAVADGRVYVGTSNGTMYALNEMTGTLNWTITLTPNNQIQSSPTIAYNQVFVGSTDNKVYALNAANGSIKWNVSTSGQVYSSPAVANGIVLIGSMDSRLYALNATTGASVWNKTIGQIKWSSPLIAEGKVFIGTTDGKLLALREENGDTWWTYQTGGAVDSSPAVLNDILYASSKDGKLYAFSSQSHDVAVLSFVASKTLVEHSEVVTFYATLWNKGTFGETVNVKSYYSSTLFYNYTFPLARGAETTLTIPLDTTSVAVGTYTILVNATLTPPAVDENTTDNTKTCQIKIEYGDVSLTNLVPSTPGVNTSKPIPIKSVVGRGYGTTIYVAVSNQGNFTEQNVQITFYWSNGTYVNQTIGIIIVPQLLPNAVTIFNFTWNTGTLAYGNYTISAYATPVPGEINTSNNRYIDGAIHVGVAGDVTGTQSGIPDGITDIRDITYVIILFQTTPNSINWKPNADISNDGIVNVKDITIAILNFRKTEQ